MTEWRRSVSPKFVLRTSWASSNMEFSTPVAILFPFARDGTLIPWTTARRAVAAAAVVHVTEGAHKRFTEPLSSCVRAGQGV